MRENSDAVTARHTNVLVVDDDPDLRSTIARQLRMSGHAVACAEGVASALAHLAVHEVDVVITDLSMDDGSGLQLLERVQLDFPGIRGILMSAVATARDHKEAMSLGAVQVLCKPFSRRDLEQAVRQASECDSGFHGRVHGLLLTDLLQMFHYSRRSVCIRVRTPVRGELFMRNGEIVHATCGALVGEEAVGRLLAVPFGAIETGPTQEVEQTIDRALDSLLLDAIRLQDETNALGDFDFGGFDDSFAAEDAAAISAAPDAAAGPGEVDPHRAVGKRVAALVGATTPHRSACLISDGRLDHLYGEVELPDWAGPALVEYMSTVERLSPGWTRLLTQMGCFGLLMIRGRAHTAIVYDAVLGRYATTRFRGDAMRLADQLEARLTD